MPSPPQNTDDLICLFSFDTDDQYGNVGHLCDCHIGFFALRFYPEECRFRPALRNDGEPDTVALIHVIYDESVNTQQNERIPIRISISKHSRYLGAGRYDYNYDDPDCPSEQELELSRKSPQPLQEVESESNFFDIGSEKFINKKNKPIGSMKMLDDLFDIHLSTTRRIRAFPLRTKIYIKETLIHWFAKGAEILEWFLVHIFGWKLNERSIEFFLRGYPMRCLERIPGEVLNLSGMQVTIRTAVLWAVSIVIIGLVYWLFLKELQFIKFLHPLFSHGLFQTASALLLAVFVNSPLPKLVLWIMNIFIRAGTTIPFKWTSIHKKFGIYW